MFKQVVFNFHTQIYEHDAHNKQIIYTCRKPYKNNTNMSKTNKNIIKNSKNRRKTTFKMIKTI